MTNNPKPDIENQSVFSDKPKPEDSPDRLEMMRVHNALYKICLESKLPQGCSMEHSSH